MTEKRLTVNDLVVDGEAQYRKLF